MENEFIIRETKHAFSPFCGVMSVDFQGVGTTKGNVVICEVKCSNIG